MEREEIMQAISLADDEAIVTLADEVLGDLEVSVTRGPTVGLLVVSAEEPSERLPFHLTEVTVSEAEVLAQNERGYAMVLGRAPEKALAGAVLDAAVVVGHPATPRIIDVLRQALDAETARLQASWERVQGTRVEFEEMAP